MRLKKIILIVAVCLISCQNASNKNGSKSDPFYTDKGGLDYARIPLIKPYDIKCLAGDENWIVSLYETSIGLSVKNIKKVNVSKDLILLYSSGSNLSGVNVKDLWVVVIPSKHIEKGFINHQAYLNYLFELGIKKEPKLYNIDNVIKYSEWHDTINWKDIK